MSGKVVSWAFEQTTGAPAAKLVLVKLADNANDHGFCWVGPDRIVTESELSLSAVYKHIATLKGLGLVRGPFETTHPEEGYPIRAYQLSVPEEWRAIPPRGKGKGRIPPGGKTIPPGGIGIPRGGKTIPPGGIHIDEPSFEPSLELSLNQEAASPRATQAPQADLLGHVPVKSRTPAETLASAYAAYAETAERAGWPAVTKQTGARDAHLRARLKDAGGLDGWREGLAKAEASDFLCGRAPPTPPRTKPFLADFDFLTTESSFVKLMEGKYDNRESAGQAGRGSGGSIAIAARVAARRAAERADRDAPG